MSDVILGIRTFLDLRVVFVVCVSSLWSLLDVPLGASAVSRASIYLSIAIAQKSPRLVYSSEQSVQLNLYTVL